MDTITTLRQDRLAYLDAQAPLPAFATFAVAVAVSVTQWTQKARTRKALKKLDHRLLEDIGKSPEEAWREAALPFWKD